MHVSSSSAIAAEASSATVDTIFEYRSSCCSSCDTRDCPAGRLEWELVRSANFAPHRGPHQLRAGQVNRTEEGVELLLELVPPLDASAHFADEVLDGLVDGIKGGLCGRLVVAASGGSSCVPRGGDVGQLLGQ